MSEGSSGAARDPKRGRFASCSRRSALVDHDMRFVLGELARTQTDEEDGPLHVATVLARIAESLDVRMEGVMHVAGRFEVRRREEWADRLTILQELLVR